VFHVIGCWFAGPGGLALASCDSAVVADNDFVNGRDWAIDANRCVLTEVRRHRVRHWRFGIKFEYGSDSRARGARPGAGARPAATAAQDGPGDTVGRLAPAGAERSATDAGGDGAVTGTKPRPAPLVELYALAELSARGRPAPVRPAEGSPRTNCGG